MFADKNTALIGLDIGTSAIKGVAVDENGEVLAEKSVRTNVHEIEEGKFEFDALNQMEQVVELLRFLTKEINDSFDVSAISMAAASGNTLLADEAGCPLSPVISWMDHRVNPENNTVLAKTHTEPVYEVVGWPAIPSFPLAHLSWFKQERSELCNQASHICMNTDFILEKMTGRWMMDPSTATTFYLRDQRSNKWHEPFLSTLGISETQLSTVAPTGTVVGPLLPHVAKATGLSTSTKVVLGAFDHPCAARGTEILRPGDVLLSCGTSWVLFMPVLDRSAAIESNLLIDPFLQPDGPWGVMASVPKIGRKVDMLIEHAIAPELNDMKACYAKFDQTAMAAEPSDLSIDLINFDDDQTISNARELVKKHSVGSVSRAIMTSAADLIKTKLETLTNAGFSADRITMVGGPTNSPVWPRIVADRLQKDIALVNGQRAGAFGAAILAGIGIGLYENEYDAWKRMTIEKSIIQHKKG